MKAARTIAAHYVAALRADPEVLAELHFENRIESWLLERFGDDVDATPDGVRPAITPLASTVRALLKKSAVALRPAAARAAKKHFPDA